MQSPVISHIWAINPSEKHWKLSDRERLMNYSFWANLTGLFVIAYRPICTNEGFKSRNNLYISFSLNLSLSCSLSSSCFLTLPSGTRGYKFEYANAAASRCMNVGTESGRPTASYARQIACRNKALIGHCTWACAAKIVLLSHTLAHT